MEVAGKSHGEGRSINSSERGWVRFRLPPRPGGFRAGSSTVVLRSQKIGERFPRRERSRGVQEGGAKLVKGKYAGHRRSGLPSHRRGQDWREVRKVQSPHERYFVKLWD